MADFTIYSSSSGLILYAIQNLYYILNGTTLNRTEVGAIPSAHKDCPLALVVDESSPQDPAFHIVCARPKFSGLSNYYMEDFSSATKEWTCHGDFTLSPIIPHTDVSVGTKAYWLTKSSGVAEYDTASNRSRIVLLPWQERVAASQCASDGYYRQLGRAGDNLCFVLVSEGSGVQVFLKRPGGDTWTYYHKVSVEIRSTVTPTTSVCLDGRIICRQMPCPFRFENREKIEILMWVDGRFVILEDDRLGGPPENLLPQRMHLVPPEGSAAAVPEGDAASSRRD